MANKSSKGSDYEREICKRLSLWWTEGTRDDVFWRSSCSGGRATTRSKQGKQTYGHYGDIAAVDSIGKPLTDIFTIELKRGYSATSFADAIDRSPKMAQQPWEAFVEQAIRSAAEAKSHSWLLVQRRDQRRAMVFFTLAMYQALRSVGAFDRTRSPVMPHIRMLVSVRVEGTACNLHLVMMSLDDFLTEVTPFHIQDLI